MQPKESSAPVGRQTMDHAIGYRADVDALRAVAVLGVIAFHWQIGFFKGGFVGVDVFFVISGFLIASILRSKEVLSGSVLRDFFERRARRLLPAMSVVIIACCVAGWFLLTPPTMNELLQSAFWGLLFCVNYFFLNQAGYFDLPSIQKPLLHLWSLGVEVQFYIVAPFLLFAAVSLRRRKFRFPYVPLALVWLVSLALCIWLTRTNQAVAFYTTPLRLWEFIFGIALVEWRFSLSPRLAPWVATLGYALILVGMILFREHSAFPGPSAALPCLGTALVIAARYVPQAQIVQRPFELLRQIGLRSFSLYLWHWPIFVFATIALKPEAHGLSRFVLMLTLTTFLSMLTYTFVEVPYRRKSRTGGLKRFAAVTAGALFAVGIANVVTRARPALATIDGGRFVNIQKFVRYDFKDLYSGGTCFLGSNARFGDIDAAKCLDVAKAGPNPVLLWGDSMAAHLLPGMRDFAGQRLLQTNASACPPLLDLDLPNEKMCREFNNGAFAFLRAHPEVRPIMAGVWLAYATQLGSESIEKAFAHTLRRLKEAGVRPIVIGAPMQLNDSLPIAMMRGQAVSTLASAGSFPLDAALRQRAVAAGVPYISILDTLCDANKVCPIVQDDEPLIWDNMHLTERGSKFEVGRIAPALREGLGEPAK